MVKNKSSLTRAMLRQLYVCGYSLEHLSEGFGYSLSSMQALALSECYASSRKAYALRRRSMQQLIMDSFMALRAGERPMVQAREALAYATAYEKVSDAETEAHHLYHAFERITQALVERVEKAPNESRKKKALRFLKDTRVVMEDILSETLKRANAPEPTCIP